MLTQDTNYRASLVRSDCARGIALVNDHIPTSLDTAGRVGHCLVYRRSTDVIASVVLYCRFEIDKSFLTEIAASRSQCFTISRTKRKIDSVAFDQLNKTRRRFPLTFA